MSKQRSTCCFDMSNVASTCRSNVRHVASTCCWCGRGFTVLTPVPSSIRGSRWARKLTSATERPTFCATVEMTITRLSYVPSVASYTRVTDLRRFRIVRFAVGEIPVARWLLALAPCHSRHPGNTAHTIHSSVLISSRFRIQRGEEVSAKVKARGHEKFWQKTRHSRRTVCLTIIFSQTVSVAYYERRMLLI